MIASLKPDSASRVSMLTPHAPAHVVTGDGGNFIYGAPQEAEPELIQFKNTTHPLTHQTLKETPAMNTQAKQITIDINGSRPHIGKTLIAGVIARALADAGFTDVTVNAPEGGVDAQSHNVVERTIDDAILSNAIVINDLNTPQHLLRAAEAAITKAEYAGPVSTPAEPFKFNPYTGEKRKPLDVDHDPYYYAMASFDFAEELKKQKLEAGCTSFVNQVDAPGPDGVQG